MPGAGFVMRVLIFPILLLSADIGLADQQAAAIPAINQVVLDSIASMPSGGVYQTTVAATRALQSAARASDGRLILNPQQAQPSYCSGATYLVFLDTLQRLAKRYRYSLTGPLAEALAVRGQHDGVGLWGRWNANGPGTACLFEELNLGRNFVSFEEAKPGDFMKIFWIDTVGKGERGHLVVFLGRSGQRGNEIVRFWSSNRHPGGFGTKTVPRSKIAQAIFSRLEQPANIQLAPRLASSKNAYLASLLTTESSFAEALQQSGAR
jgi:hypothetical protein